MQPRIVRKETREYLQSEQGQELLKDVAKGIMNDQLANVEKDKDELPDEKH